MLKIIGIGTGSPESITMGAVAEISKADRVILQTDRVPVADFLKDMGISFETIDDIYAEAEDFDELCELAAEKVDNGVFCVLGSISSNLIARAVLESHPEAEVMSGMSFGQDALDRCGISAEGVQMFSASSFEEAYIETDKPIVITEVDSPYKAADIVLKLTRYTEGNVFVIRGEKLEEMPVEDINWLSDERWSYDCAIVVPAIDIKDKVGYTFRDLTEVMSILRGFNGCPWDKKQTHKTLRQYLLEESYEAIDAIDADDDFALADELGDVLFQIAFHARIGEEQSSFDALDVTTAACRKMISRHTHIFGDDKAATAREVAQNWEQIKRAEKGQKSLTESMNDATELSPVVRAAKMQKKAALAGLGENDAKSAVDKLIADMGKLCGDALTENDAEVSGGDVIFDTINVLRVCGVSPEAALHSACRRFLEHVEKMQDNKTE